MGLGVLPEEGSGCELCTHLLVTLVVHFLQPLHSPSLGLLPQTPTRLGLVEEAGGPGTWVGLPGGLPLSEALATARLPSRPTQKTSHVMEAQGRGGDGGVWQKQTCDPFPPLPPSSTPSSSLAPHLYVPGSISLAALSASPHFFWFLCVSILLSSISSLSPDFLLLIHPFCPSP